jgi:hypothetical protein
MTTRQEGEMKGRAELSRLIQGGLNNGVAEYIADALIANGWCKFTLDDATMERAARAIKESHILPSWMPEGALRDIARAVLAAAVEAKT